MKLSKLILTAALSLTGISAFANWQPYVGIGVGMTNGTFETEVNNPPFYINYISGGSSFLTEGNSGTYNFSNTSNRLTPGFQVGIANQYNKTYLGFEASLWYNGNSYTSNQIDDSVYGSSNGALFGTVGNQVVSSVNWNTSLTTELGYFVTPNLMPFVKLGIAAAQSNVTYNFDDLPDANSNAQGNIFYTHAKPWMFGPTASLGAQYTFNLHLRGFAEVNYEKLWGSATPYATITPYGSTAFQIPSVTPFKQNYTYSSWTFELGTNYYF